jgi:hypothetical protein
MKTSVQTSVTLRQCPMASHSMTAAVGHIGFERISLGTGGANSQDLVDHRPGSI